ncbi:hypothetical protein JK202_12455 [Gluconobacter sp. Dm-62]|uniref:hypothetical protein n=1 Tax=Gluconobacter sp. Dm-62 TaxID=2799804 RepID=UPI001B8DA2C1|nr:hypothetical protein [Gluconobacter sp. Dm-62]MBS1103814.1 hypothetical protein [Gluconobacter sp. Dm-62]
MPNTLPLRQILVGVSAQLTATFQDLRRLEAICLESIPHEKAEGLQDFDRIMQVVGQLAQCCGELGLEASTGNVRIARSVMEHVTLGELRQRLLAESSTASAGSGDVDLF